MWKYTDKVIDFFNNPRNCGSMENADGIGQVGNLVCGDSMKLYIKMAKDGETIEDAKFQTFGCASAIASASALTVMIIGKKLSEAVTLTNQDIVAFLGGLPDEKEHCSVMGVEAFQAALEDMLKRRPDIKVPQFKKEDEGGRIVCRCFNVSESKIREVARSNGLTTVEQVTNYTKAGGACGKCKAEIQRILDSLNGTAAPGAATVEQPAKMTNLRKIALVQSVFEETIVPGLKADGGSAELVDIDGNNVYVRLTGKCAFCPSSMQTLKNWVEAQLREHVSPDINVVNAAQ